MTHNTSANFHLLVKWEKIIFSSIKEAELESQGTFLAMYVSDCPTSWQVQFPPLPLTPAFPTNTGGNFCSSNKSVKYRRHTVSAVCTRTACNHRNSRKTESRNIHSHYGFLWVWFIDRHVLSELYVIYNFLNFPSTPQLFCHNSVICSEQNPTNYSSARAFEAFTAVHRSIKKDNRAWVIAQALLLMASPPHSLVWGVVDGNQKQWKAHHPL